MDLVLYVNADRGAMRDAGPLFQGARFRVAATGSLSKALAYARTGAPDAIVVSIGSDTRDVLSFIRGVRGDSGSRDIPILAVTDVAGPAEIQLIGSAGATITIAKSEQGTLVQKVRDVIAAEIATRNNAADGQESHVSIEDMSGDLTVFRFKSGIRKHVLLQVRNIFTTELLNRVARRAICFDLRAVPTLDEGEATVIEKLLPLFRSRVAVIAGRHMGTLLSASDLFEKADVFLSMDEYVEFLKLVRKGA